MGTLKTYNLFTQNRAKKSLLQIHEKLTQESTIRCHTSNQLVRQQNPLVTDKRMTRALKYSLLWRKITNKCTGFTSSLPKRTFVEYVSVPVCSSSAMSWVTSTYKLSFVYTYRPCLHFVPFKMGSVQSHGAVYRECQKIRDATCKNSDIGGMCKRAFTCNRIISVLALKSNCVKILTGLTEEAKWTVRMLSTIRQENSFIFDPRNNDGNTPVFQCELF